MVFKNPKYNYLFVCVLLFGALVVWRAVFLEIPDNILEVYFFDVGQGDSIFIELPDKKQILIDGGPDKSVLEKLDKTMPFYDRYIDLVILTHPDTDHITGLVSVLEHFEIGRILISGVENNTAVYQKWQDLIREKNIPLTLAQIGQKIIFQDNIFLDVFWPDQNLIKFYSDPANNSSVTGKLTYNNIEILLTGDIEKKVETYLISQNTDLEADVLKVSHHGSKTSTNQDFLKAVNPQIAVISVGENNRYNHPSQEVLDRLKDILIYRTDQNSDIRFLTDGIKLKLAKMGFL